MGPSHFDLWKALLDFGAAVLTLIGGVLGILVALGVFRSRKKLLYTTQWSEARLPDGVSYEDKPLKNVGILRIGILNVGRDQIEATRLQVLLEKNSRVDIVDSPPLGARIVYSGKQEAGEGVTHTFEVDNLNPNDSFECKLRCLNGSAAEPPFKVRGVAVISENVSSEYFNRRLKLVYAAERALREPGPRRAPADPRAVRNGGG